MLLKATVKIKFNEFLINQRVDRTVFQVISVLYKGQRMTDLHFCKNKKEKLQLRNG